jgi:hypothetical protein
MTATWFPRIVLAMALLGAAAPPAAPAQEAGADDALDSLLKKLDDAPPPAAGDDKAKPDAPKPGEVKSEDKDLDSLLEKLGETKDEPEAKKTPMPPGGAGGDVKEKPQPGDPQGGDRAEPGAAPDRKPKAEGPRLGGKEKDLDEHLAEILGRKKKPEGGEDGQQGGGGADDSPLGQAIKKMEEVEKKLSQSDTGEGTRKTEGEIVKQLDQILEQIRQAQGGGSGKGKKLMEIKQAGNQGGKPGEQPGQENGTNAQGAGPQQPKRPSVGEMLAGRKDTWGDLPPHLREEMENVFREEMLPAKRDLIIRYYTSVAKKGRQPGGAR